MRDSKSPPTGRVPLRSASDEMFAQLQADIARLYAKASRPPSHSPSPFLSATSTSGSEATTAASGTGPCASPGLSPTPPPVMSDKEMETPQVWPPFQRGGGVVELSIPEEGGPGKNIPPLTLAEGVYQSGVVTSGSGSSGPVALQRGASSLSRRHADRLVLDEDNSEHAAALVDDTLAPEFEARGADRAEARGPSHVVEARGEGYQGRGPQRYQAKDQVGATGWRQSDMGEGASVRSGGAGASATDHRGEERGQIQLAGIALHPSPFPWCPRPELDPRRVPPAIQLLPPASSQAPAHAQSQVLSPHPAPPQAPLPPIGLPPVSLGTLQRRVATLAEPPAGEAAVATGGVPSARATVPAATLRAVGTNTTVPTPRPTGAILPTVRGQSMGVAPVLGRVPPSGMPGPACGPSSRPRRASLSSHSVCDELWSDIVAGDDASSMLPEETLSARSEGATPAPSWGTSTGTNGATQEAGLGFAGTTTTTNSYTTNNTTTNNNNNNNTSTNNNINSNRNTSNTTSDEYRRSHEEESVVPELPGDLDAAHQLSPELSRPPSSGSGGPGGPRVCAGCARAGAARASVHTQGVHGLTAWLEFVALCLRQLQHCATAGFRACFRHLPCKRRPTNSDLEADAHHAQYHANVGLAPPPGNNNMAVGRTHGPKLSRLPGSASSGSLWLSDTAAHKKRARREQGLATPTVDRHSTGPTGLHRGVPSGADFPEEIGQEPEHLEPRGARWSYRLSLELSSDRVKDAIKKATALVAAGLATGDAFAAITVGFVVGGYLGASFHISVLRVEGAVLGGIFGYLGVLHVLGKPWAQGAILFSLVSTFGFIRTSRVYAYVGLVASFMVPVIMLGYNPAVFAEPGDYVLDRIQQTVIAGLIYVGVEMVIWPVFAATNARVTLINVLRSEMGYFSSLYDSYIGMECPSCRARSADDANAQKSKIAQALPKLKAYISEAKAEPELLNEVFPMEVYHRFLAIERTMLRLLIRMHSALRAGTGAEGGTVHLYRALVQPMMPSLVALRQEVLRMMRTLVWALQLGLASKVGLLLGSLQDCCATFIGPCMVGPLYDGHM
eukprot:jgi/Mesvir1/26252/Mv01617-RA.3